MATEVVYAEPADDVRAEIIEALMYHNAAAKRCPRHWVDRRAGIHARINALLDDLEALDATPHRHAPPLPPTPAAT